MTNQPKLLALAGSLRKDSYNKRLVKIAMAGAQQAGAQVNFIDLKEMPMPIYDEDIEKADGMPANAKKFKELMKESDGFLIASPEYNSSISGALKNAIDWASRPEPGEAPLAAFAGKIAGIMSASPGALGGLRGLVTVRSILGNIQVLVIPEQVAISKAFEAFNDDGSLKDGKQQESIKNIGKKVAEIAAKLQAG